MKFEKPQEGNPHELAVNQHVFPVRSIKRFVKNDGAVDVCLLKPVKKHIQTIPTDQIFCAKRVWSHRAETGFMKEIEDKFQELAESIIKGKIHSISSKEKAIVNDFFALWNIRTHYEDRPIGDQKLQRVVDVSKHFTKDEQEVLEKNHIGFIRPDLKIPSRQIAGLQIQLMLFNWRKQLADAQWGILNAIEGKFIVPDNFSNARIVPLTPTLCLFSQSDNDSISKVDVKGINRLAVISSRKYYFARDFSKCPL